MREHRLEVADVFRAYEKEFFAKWGQCNRSSSAKSSTRSATAAPLPWAAMWSMWSSAIRAGAASSHITRAGTETARSVRRRGAPNGWLRGGLNCYRFPVPTLCLFCPGNSAGSRLQNAREIQHSVSRRSGNAAYDCGDPKRLGAAIGFLAVLHAQNPFLDSVRTIADLTGVSVSKRSLEQILPDVAQRQAEKSRAARRSQLVLGALAALIC
jgi:hypothetical protein